ncbi:molecular chaperone [Pseudomonas protegens]|uniref:fimbrial biogenesis chaperone n=1 Tax=Pseudomonas protegens TaxID=380021 RepID=UPI003906D4AE
MIPRAFPFFLVLMSLLTSTQSTASISLSATRIVFDAGNKEANITVRNGNQDTLIQSWIDSKDSKNSSPHFAVIPALARISANEQQLLRVIYEGTGMAQGKESVIWLNIQEIPKAPSAKNTLQLAVRQRIKVFYRPAGLPGDALSAPTGLQWTLSSLPEKRTLVVKNPTPYYVSMSDIQILSSGREEMLSESMMIAPDAEIIFPINIKFDTNIDLNYHSINDYGARHRYTAKLNSKIATHAKLTDTPISP